MPIKIIDTQQVSSYGGRHTIKTAICECGEEITLDDFTNTCHKCGADYDFQGYRLAAREAWGEETGEHWADVARITWWK